MKNSSTRFLRSILLCVSFALILTACGGTTSSSTPTAQQLISKAQVAIQKVSAYHFNLAADNPGTGSLLTITGADGDMLVPDKLKATATALILANTIQVQIISIGDKQYMTDPITGKWSPTSGLLNPTTLSSSQTGVAAILGNIQNPSTPVDSNSDGTPCWQTQGQLAATYLAPITGGGVPAGTQVATTVCIGKTDNLPYFIRMNGIAVQNDTSKTVRTFKLSKFNESLTINAPSLQ